MKEESVNTPIGINRVNIPDLGHLDGFSFEGGITQYGGIPYGSLKKRWTRATLVTLWKDNYHDGTKLGPCVPVPLFGGEEDGDVLTPVSQMPHFKSKFRFDEKNALVLNIARPEVAGDTKIPVMVYIHGGSWMYGTSNLGIFDGVNLVKKSVEENMPILVVNFNYRVGIGGFLASQAIQEDLEKDGLAGCGNFGLTDQLLALEWVNKYISHFGGDKENVTIVGESAGGCSVSNHVFSNINPKVKRAVSMSGVCGTIPAFSKEWHEKEYQKVLAYFKIENDSLALETLREIPELELAQATKFIQNTPEATTGNPCVDGWYLSENYNMARFKEPPSWLAGYMFGDTKDEGLIFKDFYKDLTYDNIIHHFENYLTKAEAESILELYEVTESSRIELLPGLMVKLMGDLAFVLPNYVLALESVGHACQTFLYHFDELSTIDNIFYGTSYHALDLLYLFGNRRDFNQSQKNLRSDFMMSFVKFVNGKEPWEAFNKRKKVMRFGPRPCSLSGWDLLDLEEDNMTRHYQRLDTLLGLPKVQLENFFLGLDSLTNQRN